VNSSTWEGPGLATVLLSTLAMSTNPRTHLAMPAVFVAHGSPMVAVEHDGYDETLARLAAELPRPRAIIVVSAHWETAGQVRVTTAARLRTIHDFGGFPEALYRIQYTPAGDPALAERVIAALREGGLDAVGDPTRGLDHGAWVPLRFLYPEADVPVVAVSLPVPRSEALLSRLGAALARFRDEGVLVVGSGGLVHNLRRVVFADKYASTEAWAREFDDWVAARLAEGDLAGLSAWETSAPNARLAVPTSEHFDPALVVTGAARAAERVSTVYEGFHHGTLSMRSFAYGRTVQP
jgi:4,5-DOPA dioxygenase extradiol